MTYLKKTAWNVWVNSLIEIFGNYVIWEYFCDHFINFVS